MKSLGGVLTVCVVTVAVWHAPAGAQPPTGTGDARGPRPPGPGLGLPRFALLEALDADRDGKLSRVEIENAARALAALDQDADGKLSRAEIGWPPQGFGPGNRRGPRRGWGPPGAGPDVLPSDLSLGPQNAPTAPSGTPAAAEAAGPPADLVQRLMAYDRDGDGRVTKAELPRGRHAILDQADANQDGAVDRDELTGFIERLPRGDTDPPQAR
jgi:uncharacterized protein (DUF2141 family)